MIQYTDFWETVAQNVDIVRADIDKLASHKVILVDGSSIDADAIFLGTGYKDILPFFSDNDCIALGLPHDTSLESPVDAAEWKQLESEAEKKIIGLYPALGSTDHIPQHFGDVDLGRAPFRLYHGLGPLNSDPSVAFVGFCVHTNMFESAELAALWAVAYLDGNVEVPALEEMKKEIAYTTAYMRLRVPTYGRAGNFYLYDTFAHQTQLLDHDLHLKSWLPKSWWAKWFHPSLPSDFKGIKDEYLNIHGGNIVE
jgi:dimethylaniline monooxygenase (N-oxide forming)